MPVLREVPDSFREPPNFKTAPRLKALVADTVLYISGQLPEERLVSAYYWKKISRQKYEGSRKLPEHCLCCGVALSRPLLSSARGSAAEQQQKF